MQARIAAREVISLESGVLFGYDCGLKSDEREMSVQVFLPVGKRWKNSHGT